MKGDEHGDKPRGLGKVSAVSAKNVCKCFTLKLKNINHFPIALSSQGRRRWGAANSGRGCMNESGAPPLQREHTAEEGRACDSKE